MWLSMLSSVLSPVCNIGNIHFHDDKFCYEALLWLGWICLRWSDVVNVFVLTMIRSNWQHSEEWNDCLSCSRHWILGSERFFMFLKEVSYAHKGWIYFTKYLIRALDIFKRFFIFFIVDIFTLLINWQKLGNIKFY